MRITIGFSWLLVLGLAVTMPAGTACAAEAPAAEAAPPAAASDSPIGPDAEAHYAKGEALYDGKWMPIQKLFEKYRQDYDRLQYIKKHGSDSQEQLNELQREMAALRGEERKAEQPIRRELGLARQGLRKYNNILRQKPPAKPRLQDLPPPPPRPRRNSSRNYSGNDSYGRSRDDSYQRARRQWQQTCDQIKRHNEMKTERYQREMKEYQEKQSEAKAELPKLEAKARELMKQLEEIDKEYDNKAAPTRQRSENVVEQVRAHGRRVDVIAHDVEQMADALRAVPEKVRARKGIVEFEGAFHSAETLQHQYKEQQSEVDRVREKLQADCEQMGLPFPEDWRHPQQNRLDKMKALIEKVKAAREATG
jgi:myosin heavy subunit